VITTRNKLGTNTNTNSHVTKARHVKQNQG